MTFWFYSAVTRNKVLIFFAHSSATCVYVVCTSMHVVCIYMFKFKYVWYMCIPLCILMWRVCLCLKVYPIPHQWLPQAKEACSAMMILGFVGLLSILFKCIMLRASCVLPVDTGSSLFNLTEQRESKSLKKKGFPCLKNCVTTNANVNLPAAVKLACSCSRFAAAEQTRERSRGPIVRELPPPHSVL